jgi:hypothetical protein
MQLFFYFFDFFYFFVQDTLKNIVRTVGSHHTVHSYMMRRALMSGITSLSCDEAGAGWV